MPTRLGTHGELFLAAQLFFVSGIIHLSTPLDDVLQAHPLLALALDILSFDLVALLLGATQTFPLESLLA